VNSRACLDAASENERKSLPLPRIEPRPSNPLKYEFNSEVKYSVSRNHITITFTETFVKPLRRVCYGIKKREGKVNAREAEK
jgi:hypothetical protein